MNVPRVAIAANNGDIGGGEVMLLALAGGMRDLGLTPEVIGPCQPSGVVDEARARGFSVTPLPAHGRRAYLTSLARWRLRNTDIPLWCNGLVPALATAGLGPRVVHLHKLPDGLQWRALRLARMGARCVVVPSDAMARRIPGARVLPNWTAIITSYPTVKVPSPGEFTVGMIGRLTRAKGVDVLLRAVEEARRVSQRRVRLILAGENRFGSTEDDDAIRPILARMGDVETPGWMDRDEFFSRVDLAVFPSVEEESFGLVVAEAMGQGVPFVISDLEAFREVAGPGHPWVARRGDPASLAAVTVEALRAVQERPSAEVRRRQQARRRWETHFSPEAGRRGLAELLMSLPKGQP